MLAKSFLIISFCLTITFADKQFWLQSEIVEVTFTKDCIKPYLCVNPYYQLSLNDTMTGNTERTETFITENTEIVSPLKLSKHVAAPNNTSYYISAAIFGIYPSHDIGVKCDFSESINISQSLVDTDLVVVNLKGNCFNAFIKVSKIYSDFSLATNQNYLLSYDVLLYSCVAMFILCIFIILCLIFTCIKSIQIEEQENINKKCTEVNGQMKASKFARSKRSTIRDFSHSYNFKYPNQDNYMEPEEKFHKSCSAESGYFENKNNFECSNFSKSFSERIQRTRLPSAKTSHDFLKNDNETYEYLY